MKSRRIRQVVMYGLFFLGMLILALYWRFPADIFREAAVLRVAEACPACSLSIQGMVLQFPSGLRLERTELTFAGLGAAGVEADLIQIYPDPWKFFTGGMNLEMRMTGYGGRAWGASEFSGILAPWASSVVMRFEDISVGKMSFLKPLLGEQTSGTLKGTFSYDRRRGSSTGSGRVDFTVLDGAFPLQNSVPGINRLEFNRIDGQLVLAERSVKIEFINVNGQDVRCAMKGEVLIDPTDFGKSRLSVTGSMELKALNYRKFPLSITGTLMNPVTKIG